MRRRINLLVTAVTALVVVAFVIPLGLLVRQQADQRGRIEAERHAQTLAAVVVRSVALAEDPLMPQRLADSLGPLPDGTAVVLPDGFIVGELVPDSSLVEDVKNLRSTKSTYLDDGFALAVPVLTRAGTIVVYASVPKDALTGGVWEAWLLLGLLGFFLIVAAVVVADRLGRTVVSPSRRLAEAADSLGRGDLTTRVEEEGPPELRSIGTAFNVLAARVNDLLAAEREQVADLSHRLRTPLTALSLQAEQLEEPQQRLAIQDKVERLRDAIDEVITEARRRPEEGPPSCEVSAVVRRRIEFWSVLAEEQERPLHTDLSTAELIIPIRETELAAALDALIGNVFTHTAPATGFTVTVSDTGDYASIRVADDGTGFPTELDPSGRGVSGSGSSGLGLDIARRLAEAHGGTLHLDASDTAGASATMTISMRP